VKEKNRVVFLDIETTSLDAFSGVIVGFGLIMESGKEYFALSKSPDDEVRIIRDLLKKLEKCQVVVTWNGKRFDFPFIITRALKLNVDASVLCECHHIDLAEFVKYNMAMDYASLDRVSRFFEINKNHDLSGSDIPRLYLKILKGDKKAASLVKEHCLDDLRALKMFYQKVKSMLRVRHSDIF